MEIRQIQHFLAVVETGSLTAAARSLDITQSGISMSLAVLERELGAPLFLRSPGRRRAELTEAGQALVPSARALLDQVVAAHNAVASVQDPVTAEVRVASIGAPSGLTLQPAWESFHIKHPGSHLSLLSGSTARVIELVRNGEVDFGIAAVDPHECADLDVRTIVASPMAILLPAAHRLASESTLRLQDFKEEHIIGMVTEHKARRLFDQWLLRQDGASLMRPDIECEDPVMMLTYLVTGAGISYSPKIFERDLIPQNLTLVPLEEGPVWYLSTISKRESLGFTPADDLHQSYLLKCRSEIAADPSLRPYAHLP